MPQSEGDTRPPLGRPVTAPRPSRPQHAGAEHPATHLETQPRQLSCVPQPSLAANKNRSQPGSGARQHPARALQESRGRQRLRRASRPGRQKPGRRGSLDSVGAWPGKPRSPRERECAQHCGCAGRGARRAAGCPEGCPRAPGTKGLWAASACPGSPGHRGPSGRPPPVRGLPGHRGLWRPPVRALGNGPPGASACCPGSRPWGWSRPRVPCTGPSLACT